MSAGSAETFRARRSSRAPPSHVRDRCRADRPAAPESTNRAAVARPMPLAPPVTSATRPSNLRVIIVQCFASHQCRDAGGGSATAASARWRRPSRRWTACQIASSHVGYAAKRGGMIMVSMAFRRAAASARLDRVAAAFRADRGQRAQRGTESRRGAPRPAAPRTRSGIAAIPRPPVRGSPAPMGIANEWQPAYAERAPVGPGRQRASPTRSATAHVAGSRYR